VSKFAKRILMMPKECVREMIDEREMDSERDECISLELLVSECSRIIMCPLE
jgi:hypothetical protein